MKTVLVIFIVLSALQCHGQVDWESRLEKVNSLLPNYPDSAYHLTTVLLLEIRDSNDLGKVRCHGMLGWIDFEFRREFDSSALHYLKAINLAEKSNSERMYPHLVTSYQSCGVIFTKFRSYKLSEKYTRKAVELAAEQGDSVRVASLKFNLSRILSKTGNPSSAIEMLKSIMPNDTYRVMNRIGTIYRSEGKYDSAILWYNRMLSLGENFSLRRTSAIYHNLGGNYAGKLDHDSAIYCFKEALKIKEKLSIKDYSTDAALKIPFLKTLTQLADTYITLGEIDHAETLLKRGETLINSLSHNSRGEEVFIELYTSLAKVANLNSRKDESARYTQLYYKELEKYSAIYQRYDFDLIVQNFYDQKAQEEKEATYKFYAATISGSLLVLLALTFSANRYQKHRSKKKDEKNLTEKKIAELKALKAQINPHFLFNALNSIQSFILEDEKNIAQGYLVKYGKLMRKILDHSNELTAPLNEELEALNLYIELEQLRVKQGFEFEVEIDENIDLYITNVPSMVIQPFLENAIWHGISKLDERGKIILQISEKDEWIEVAIKDNGEGFDTAKTNDKSHASKGVQLVKERLELLKESAGEQSVVEIQSEVGKGTAALLRFSNDLS